MKNSAIVLDMDNTILRSHIDFVLMQQLVGLQLADFGCVPNNWRNLTTAQIIESAKDCGMTNEQEADIWYTVGEVERFGMADATAELGVITALESLKEKHILMVVTNNAACAANEALERTGLLPLMDKVMAREEMLRLKPEPDSLIKLKLEYPNVLENNWLFIGDSWVDGMAAQKANMAFALYDGHRKEDWTDRDIPLVFKFSCWDNIEEKLISYKMF